MNTATKAPAPIPLTLTSSNLIHSHGFDGATGTLEVQFRSKKRKDGAGARYQYPCSPEMYGEFCGAESLGRFFGQRIRNNADMPAVEVAPELPDEAA